MNTRGDGANAVPFLTTLGATSIVGRREENQDRCGNFSSRWGDVIVVADGMGGCEGGATAAQLIVDRLPGILDSQRADADLREVLNSTVQSLNDQMTEAQQSSANLHQMGSTLVLALRQGSFMWIANVGDSRAYLWRAGLLSRLTTDHTVGQRLIDAQELRPEDASSHPQNSVLTRVVGHGDRLVPDIVGPLAIEPADTWMLCSDGLSGVVSDDEIARIFRHSSKAQQLSHDLAQLAFDEGSTDNVTVQVLQVPGIEPAPMSSAESVNAGDKRGKWIAAAVLLILLLGTVLWTAGRLSTSTVLKRELPIR